MFDAAQTTWIDISLAPRDRTPILAALRQDLVVHTGRFDLQGFEGIQVVMQHVGPSGWELAVPGGRGGFEDDWISGWKPLGHGPTPLASTGPVEMIYRNWKKSIRQRRIIPVSLHFGTTEWHPEPGWLLSALDEKEGVLRDFALSECDFLSMAEI